MNHSKSTFRIRRQAVVAIIVLPLCAAIVIFFLVPALINDQQNVVFVRDLSGAQIDEIGLNECWGKSIDVAKKDDIALFSSLLNKAQVFYPSHNITMMECRLVIDLKYSPSIVGDVSVYKLYPNDIVVEFEGHEGIGEISVPGGGAWLKKVLSTSSSKK